jgi:hypothetical protein
VSDRDDDLLAELRGVAARIDPAPDELVAAARAAFAWRTMDAELAELVGDPASEDGRLVGVRSDDLATLLSFEAPGLSVEVEVLVTGERRRLLGQLVPGGPARVEVRHRAGLTEVVADEIGRFAADDLPPGPVSLRSQGAEGRWVETDWFLA